MSDLTTGRIQGTPADLQQPLPAVENDRPVANRETPRETTATPYYTDDLVTLHHGDCLDVLRSLPTDSVDAVVTDPPYGLGFMGKEWDTIGDTGRGSRVRVERADEMTPTGQGHSTSAGPYLAAGIDSLRSAGRPYQEWCEQWARECLRVLKPGGHMLAFGGTRTAHRLASAIEDAGFELRDTIAWLYGSGFPKSRNLDGDWQGWGTALKPANEPIIVARKNPAGTVTANVLTYGTGALHIDACRTSWGAEGDKSADRKAAGYSDAAKKALGGVVASECTTGFAGEVVGTDSGTGRWPTNVLLDEHAAADLDQQSGNIPASGVYNRTSGVTSGGGANYQPNRYADSAMYADSGGASRFFPTFRYEAKAPSAERPRIGTVAHPTVKPLDLMRWLVRLVTPPGGTVLEPFAGSGTTAEACIVEGFRCIAIERESDYIPLILARISKPIEPVLFGESA